MSSERDDLRAAFLAANGFGAASRQPLSGDASTRLYERLRLLDGTRLIFMDQPPVLETPFCPPGAGPAQRSALGYNAANRLAAGSVAAFVATAAYLRGLGLSAPKVLAHDVEAGLAVLEDLGDGLYATLIDEGQDERPLYEAAVDVQVALQAAPPPDLLEAGGVSWPLLTYDALALKVGTDTFLEFWPKFAGLPAFAPDAVAEWNTLCPRLGGRRSRRDRLHPPRFPRPESALAAGPRGSGARRTARFPGRPARPSGLGSDASAAGRPARRFPRTGTRDAGPVPGGAPEPGS